MDRRTSWIAASTGGRLLGPDVTVTGPVVTDSREVVRGSVFVARRGETADGHDHVADAAAAGAVCTIVEHAVGGAPPSQVIVPDSTRALAALARAHLEDLRTRGPLDVTGITGSAGKTSTKDLLAQVLSRDAATVWPRLSYNNEVGVPVTVLRAEPTTRHLVLEMGASAPGDLIALTRIAPLDVAVELMVGTAHLAGFGSREGIARAKAELLSGLLPGGVAVLNADDPRVAAMARLAPGRVVRFSEDPSADADVRASGVVTDEGDHASFRLETPDGRADVRLRVAGGHNVHNALAAAAVAHVLGMSVADIAGALSHAELMSPHRMAVSSQEVAGRRITLIDDSYNANPDSMRAGLRALRDVSGSRRRIAVLGEMLELGPLTRDLHRQVGEEAAAVGVDAVIAVGPDARGVLTPLPPHVIRRWTSTPEEAIAALTDLVEDGDVVLVKGSNASGVWRVADELQRQGVLE